MDCLLGVPLRLSRLHLLDAEKLPPNAMRAPVDLGRRRGIEPPTREFSVADRFLQQLMIMADVFVSYARSDKPRVAPLVAAIQARGWSVWWDPAIDPGQEFDRQIAAELKATAAVLVVWTPVSVESRWVRGEAREGADRGVLVPVRFDGASLPIDVRALHTTDLDGWDGDPQSPQCQEVLRALSSILARQPGDPTSPAKAPEVPLPPAGGTARVAICVLPFTNMSGDPEQEHFSDGITEDIITELSRWRLLSVRSRSASFRYRGVAVDMKHVARELNVRYIVEGSVRRIGDRIRITAQLIDADSGSHIWGEKYDRNLAEVFSVQDQLVQKIVSTLVGRVQAADIERARRKPPKSLAAYEYVLKANALPWDELEGAAEATRLLEAAIKLDPDYGLAYAVLAAVRWDSWYRDRTGSDAGLQEAYILAKRAVELDQNESTCYAMLGHACLRRRSFDQALQYARRAIELNPTNPWNRADMGDILNYVGRAEDALASLKVAREIDPYFEEPWYWRSMGQAYMVLHRYEEALEAFDHASVRSARLLALAAGCLARLNDFDRLKATKAECLTKDPDFSIRHFVSKEPFRFEGDAAHLAESLRLAGLPE
jgi:TolB-like protein/cytochrome c-type biogenesis protein CcmH/NrfG